MVRVYGVSKPSEGAEPEYLQGLRTAVRAALDYAFGSLELGEERSPPIPTPMLAQARLAARHGISLDTVLRRYLSGYIVLVDFALQEAEAEVPLCGTSLHRLLQAQGAQFDRVIAAIAEEYNRESESQPLSGEKKRVEGVRRLLAGEPLDTTGFDYDFEVWHLGLVLGGADGDAVLKDLARSLDRRLLRVRPQWGTTWAWLGGRHSVDSAEVAERVRSGLPDGSVLAMGEPGCGLAGWRLSHGQAKVAFGLAREQDTNLMRYVEAGLLASVLKDEILVSSLRQLYLAPLAEETDGGEALRSTLRAYFSTGRNVTSAAALLGLSRPTVRARLHAVEDKVGQPLEERATEIELALEVDRIFGPVK